MHEIYFSQRLKAVMWFALLFFVFTPKTISLALPGQISYVKYIILILLCMHSFIKAIKCKCVELNSFILFILLLCFCVIIVCSSFQKDANRLGGLIYAVNALGFMCLSSFILTDNDKEIWLKSTVCYFIVDTLINQFVIFARPEGLRIVSNIYPALNSGELFIGSDNSTLSIYFLLLMFSAALCIYNSSYHKLFYISFALFGLYSFSRVIGTGIIVFWIICILLLLFRLNKRELKNWGLKIFLFNIISYILIVVIRVQEHVANLIFMLTGKNAITLGRTEIWDRTIEMIIKSPWLGYGVRQSIVYDDYSWSKLTMAYVNSGNVHNAILYILFTGGFIAFIIYLCLLFFSFRKFDRTLNNKYSAFLICGMIGILLRGMVEIDSGYIFMVLPMFFYYNSYSCESA